MQSPFWNHGEVYKEVGPALSSISHFVVKPPERKVKGNTDMRNRNKCHANVLEEDFAGGLQAFVWGAR